MILRIIDRLHFSLISSNCISRFWTPAYPFSLSHGSCSRTSNTGSDLTGPFWTRILFFRRPSFQLNTAEGRAEVVRRRAPYTAPSSISARPSIWFHGPCFGKSSTSWELGGGCSGLSSTNFRTLTGWCEWAICFLENLGLTRASFRGHR